MNSSTAEILEFTPAETLPVVVFDFENAVTATKQEIREFIAHVEDVMRTAPQIETPHKVYQSANCYAREMLIKKGWMLAGKIHKYSTVNVILKGEVSVFSQDGYMRIKGPHTFVSTPGAKRIIVAHEDTIWTCFHGTTETDEAKIEEQMIAKTYDEVVELPPREVVEPLKLKEKEQ